MQIPSRLGVDRQHFNHLRYSKVCFKFSFKGLFVALLLFVTLLHRECDFTQTVARLVHILILLDDGYDYSETLQMEFNTCLWIRFCFKLIPVFAILSAFDNIPG